MSIATDQKTISAMIQIYCNENHNTTKGSLCSDCSDLLNYALVRLEKCPFGPDKGPCAQCHVHCYKPQLRDKIKVVMRFAGPKMLSKHPLLAMRHLLKGKLKKAKE